MGFRSFERKRIVWQGRYHDHEDDCISDVLTLADSQILETWLCNL